MMKHRGWIRLSAIILALILVFGSMGALAASITEKEALKIARKEVPAKAKLVETEWDKKNKEWEFEFLTRNKKQKYEVEVSKKTGNVIEIEMELQNVGKAGKYSVKKAAAEKTVLEAFPDATKMKIRKVTEDGSKIYRITFVTAAFKGEVKIHGENGKIIKWEKKY